MGGESGGLADWMSGDYDGTIMRAEAFQDGIHHQVNVYVRAPRMFPVVDGLTGADWALARLDDRLVDAQCPRSPGHRHPLVVGISCADMPRARRLAVDWLTRVGHRFLDGHLYVDLRNLPGPEPVAGGLRLLLEAFGVDIDAGAGMGHEVRVEELAAAWRTVTDRRWVALAVVGVTSRRMLRPFLSGSEHSATVAVSDQPIDGLHVHGGFLIDLDDDQAAIRAEQRGTDSLLNNRDWLYLMRVCQKLPLAKIAEATDSDWEDVRTALADVGLAEPLSTAEQKMLAKRKARRVELTTGHPISELNLSCGTIAALERNEIHRIGDLLKRMHDKLTELNGIGEIRDKEIRHAIDKTGFENGEQR